ncbi:hypothetical protein [Candidatus Thiosymbion oneisti]|uniref:hypothetical protein n=1 Tax=Candidatus Thiosymbion oneisti TaxID=589554 RepID=UPI001061BB74|nr:hypothetical protein [Candidatus Thiosymbion oneisti]
MWPFDFLVKFIPSKPEKIPPRDQSWRNDEIVCSVTRRNAEGNVLLGKGNILTAKEKERAFAELKLG